MSSVGGTNTSCEFSLRRCIGFVPLVLLVNGEKIMVEACLRKNEIGIWDTEAYKLLLQ